MQLVGIPRLGRVARGVPDDCSGLVRLAYQKAGIDLVSEDMNLAFPRTHREGQGGSILNDILRPASRGQRAWLSGELFAGFASPAAL